MFPGVLISLITWCVFEYPLFYSCCNFPHVVCLVCFLVPQTYSWIICVFVFSPQFTALKLSSLVHFPISQVLHLGPLPACHTATCDRSLIPVWTQWTQLRVIGKRQFLLSCKKCCGRSLGLPLSASRSILEPSLRGAQRH